MNLNLSDKELAQLQQAFDWARTGDIEGLTEHLDAGRPVNLSNNRGDTLLMLAAYHVQAGAVDLLLTRGADVDRVNDNGQTALGAAVFRRSAPVVDRLLAAGAGVDAGTRSARDVARFFGLDDMRRLIGDLGPQDQPATDEHGGG